MHGLYGKAFRSFVTDTYGEPAWIGVAERAGIAADGFEAMSEQPASAIIGAVAAAAETLDKSRGTILVDIGVYLVSHRNTERLRRLLRFGGTDFNAFVHSVEDIPERARLAVPDLRLPAMELTDEGSGYVLTVRSTQAGSGLVILGVLQAMADDYGALAIMEYGGAEPVGDVVVERITIEIAMHTYAEGRQFELGARPS